MQTPGEGGETADRGQPASIRPIELTTGGVPCELTYTLERGELFRANLRAMLGMHNRVMRVVYIVIVLWSAYRGFQPSLGFRFLLVPRLFSAGVSVAFTASVMVASMVVMTGAMAFVAKNRGVIGAHTIAITDAGLVAKSDVNEATHKWAGMYEVREAGAFVYLYLTEGRFMAIPLRAFASDAEGAAFAEVIRRRLREARGA